jgi:hypothetical protein
VRQAVVSGLYPELREKVEGKELVVYSAEPNVDVLDPSDEHGGRLKKLLDECEFSSDMSADFEWEFVVVSSAQ